MTDLPQPVPPLGAPLQRPPVVPTLPSDPLKPVHPFFKPADVVRAEQEAAQAASRTAQELAAREAARQARAADLLRSQEAHTAHFSGT